MLRYYILLLLLLLYIYIHESYYAREYLYIILVTEEKIAVTSVFHCACACVCVCVCQDCYFILSRRVPAAVVCLQSNNKSPRVGSGPALIKRDTSHICTRAAPVV